MIADLPGDIALKTEWVLVTPELMETRAYYPAIRQAFLDACRRPGWNPKTVQMGGFMRAIDYCAHAHFKVCDEFGMKVDHSHPHSFKVCVAVDHPVLRFLPRNCPRSVRHLYRADNRLRWTIADDAQDLFQSIIRAENDWGKYLNATAPAQIDAQKEQQP